MGNALYSNWDDTQSYLYGLQLSSSNSIMASFGAVIFQYIVSQWIWSAQISKNTKNPHHHFPIYIISLIFFWIIYSIIFNSYVEGVDATDNQKYIILILVFLFAGIPLNILFFSLWKEIFFHDSSRVEDDLESGATGNNTNFASDQPSKEEPTQNKVNASTPSAPAQNKSTKPKIEYINNIKIFLTNVVIIHHCSRTVLGGSYETGVGHAIQYDDASNPANIILELISGINSSYFMQLFFFYSGYFTPTSLDRKGTFDFLFERAKRLIIPNAAYTFILGPYVEKGISSMLLDGSFTPDTITNTGVSWFLAQLLLMNIAYVFACGNGWHPKIAFPGITKLLLCVGLPLGLIIATILLFFPSGSFFFGTPRFWNDYLSFVVFFFGGALARRNKWLDELQNISKKTRIAIYVLCLVLIILMFTGSLVQPFAEKYISVAALLHYVTEGIVLQGVATFVWSLAITVFFMDFVNKKYFSTDFFTKAMYTAYIIQFVFPMQIAFYLYTLVLNASGVNLEFVDNVAQVSSGGIIFGGWLFISVVTLLICWPSAYLIYSIPGFSQVL